MKKQTRLSRRNALSGRLLAYSVMAGAALAFAPAVDAAIVYPNDNSIAGITSSNEVLIQSLQTQSQRVRHQQRHLNRGHLRALASSSSLSGSNSSYYSSTNTTYGTPTTGAE